MKAIRIKDIAIDGGTQQREHAVYVVKFSDGRIKIGISANVRARMKYYKQEITRNRIESATWWSCKPFSDKFDALFAERTICSLLKEKTIPDMREWFRAGTVDFEDVIKSVEIMRGDLGDEAGIDKLDIPYYGDHGFILNGAVARGMPL